MWFTILLIGCGGKESTGTWLEHSRFNWVGANHRLTHYEMGVTDDDVYVSMVGGTSTTGIFQPLDDGCESENCDEFPIRDRAEIEIGWARATTTDGVFGSGTAALEVDAAGGTGTVEVSLPHEAKGTASAVLRGWTWDTNLPLSGGTACYRPGNGWLPKGFSITLGDPTLAADGLSVSVPVSASFTAGPTYEDERVCLDAVIEQAVVALEVDVLAVVSTAETESLQVAHDLAYAYQGTPLDPGMQPDPNFAERSLDTAFTSPFAGWSKVDFRFHEVGQTRGAYVRTLAVHVGPDQAWGHATNYSPGTQLSGFDYAFAGTVSTVDLDHTVERGRVNETVDVTILDDGSPEQFRFLTE